jgi:hypothetical protein
MSEYDVSLSMSYMEIYRDEVYDLLVDRETVRHVFHSLVMAMRTRFAELMCHTTSLPAGPQITSQGE